MPQTLAAIGDRITYRTESTVITLQWVREHCYHVYTTQGPHRVDEHCRSWPSEDSARAWARMIALLYTDSVSTIDEQIIGAGLTASIRHHAPSPFAVDASDTWAVTVTTGRTACDPMAKVTNTKAEALAHANNVIWCQRRVATRTALSILIIDPSRPDSGPPLTIRDVADRCGVHVSTVYRWRSGVRVATEAHLAILTGLINAFEWPRVRPTAKTAA